MTTKSTHTPGPWLVHPDVPGQIVVDDGEGGTFLVAEVERAMQSAEGDANARLIAAAPDLLAALRIIAYGIIGRMDASYAEVVEGMTDIAKAALARAEGRKP